MKRKQIPDDLRKKLLLYCRYECCLCDKKISGKREHNIHHINGNPNDNREGNLIPLCPNCHVKADKGEFSEDHLKIIKKAKIKKLGIRDSIEQIEKPSVDFKMVFTSKLDECVNMISKEPYSHEINDKIDELTMLLKERIERWDIPSVRFGTRELFLKLYKYSGEEKKLSNLYAIYEDLFRYAYSQRKHILGNMIRVFYIILFESWVPEYDVEKADKSCDILLRLGLDFLDDDLSVSDSCFTAIDNLAGDMFEPEILSKEIIFGASVLNKKDRSQKMKDFFEKIVGYIAWNDKYAWDDENYSYLIDSLNYAKNVQANYGVDVEELRANYLIPIAKQNMNERINGFIQFIASQECSEEHLEFEAELLTKLVLSYEKINPKISEEIRSKVKKTKNKDLKRKFNKIIRQNNFLEKAFLGSEMITTIKEFVEFIEKNADMANLGVGLTTFGLSWITFSQRLTKRDKEKLRKLAKKYDLLDAVEFEIEDESVTFLMDNLVYLGNNRCDMKRLVQFLEEIYKKFKVKSLTTGISFEFRDIS